MDSSSANHVLTLSRLLQACMHLHHDTRPGLWHAAFGFDAGFGARARGLASSVSSHHAAWLHCRFALAGGEEVYEMSPASTFLDLRQHIQALRCLSAEVKVQLFAANTKRRLPLDASLLINFIGCPGWPAELALRLDVVLIPQAPPAMEAHDEVA